MESGAAEKFPILNQDEIRRITQRMAYQIYEFNCEEPFLTFVGVEGQGFRFGQALTAEFARVSPIPYQLLELSLDKKAPTQSEVQLSASLENAEEGVVILVDDVLNTGRTIAYALKPFMGLRLKKLELAVLVDRGYHLFPVSANYTGYELSTTLQEHIFVELDAEAPWAYIR